MKRRTAVHVLMAVSAAATGSCKGDAKLTTYSLEPDAGTADGYRGGTPITLADGTSVTLADGTKVTTPKVPGKAVAGDDEAVHDATSPTTRDAGTSPTYLETTGTTSPTAVPTDALSLPTPGVYKFRDTIAPDDGSKGVDHDTWFKLTSDAPQTVRVQESDASGSPKSSAFYEERHDDDGLWLTASALDAGVCRWDPKSASLPRSVIEGGTVITNAKCAAGDRTLRLETRIAFKLVRDVTISGRKLRCIDVTRHRVLTDGDSTVTSDAVDTYSFELGMRVAASEHSTSKSNERVSGFTRNLVLLSLPS